MEVRMKDQQAFEVWKQWKTTGDEAHLKELNKMFKPYSGRVAAIYKKQGVRLPDPVIDSITQDVVLKAIKRYDPKYGSLRKWVASYLQKVKSTVAWKQNFLRIPETRVYDIGKYKRTVSGLEGTKKRVRTKDIAKALNWDVSKVQKLEKELGASTLGSSVPFATSKRVDPLEDAFHMVRPSLSDRDKQVYDLLRSGTKSTRELSQKMKVSEPEISRSKSRIFKQVKDVHGS